MSRGRFWRLLVARWRCLLLVLRHRLPYRAHCRRQCFRRRLDSTRISAAARGFECVDFFLHVLLDILAHLLAMLFERLLGGIYELVGGVLRFYEFFLLEVAISVRFRIFAH